MELNDFLYEKDGFLYYRDKMGHFKKAPKNKFKHKQFVKRKHDIVRLVDPSYNEQRGWYYGINYIDLQGQGGGASFSWNESDFKEITNPIEILMVSKIEMNEKIKKLDVELEVMQNNLSKIIYSLDISFPKHNHVKHICKSCESFFIGFEDGGNPNMDLCKNCLKE